jgi:CBS domain-containing protein
MRIKIAPGRARSLLRIASTSAVENIMKVKDVMHLGATWFAPNTPLSQIAKKMREQDIGAVPIGEDDRLIGMVTDRDMVCRGLANGHDASKLTARDVMSKGISYCRSDDDLDDAIEEMSNKHIRRLAVIDDKKRMVGMLSMGDISRKADKAHFADFMQSVSAHHA